MRKISLSVISLLTAFLLGYQGVAGQNLLTNPGFEHPDSRVADGNVYMSTAYGYTAAESWSYADNGDRTVPHTTQLLPSTAPSGSLHMMCISTSGPSDGPYQYFLPSSAAGVNNATARVWVKVTRGRMYIAAGRNGGISNRTDSAVSTGWQLLQLNSGANYVTGMFLYASTSGGADFCVDDAEVTSPACPDDTDADGQANCTDPDDDNDGVADGADAFPVDGSEWADADHDGTGDNADVDDDNDGQTDADERSCGSDPLNSADLSLDADGDHVPNCVDTDDDNDTVPDSSDNCQFKPNPGQEDFDGDGIGDACETDPVKPATKDACKNAGWMIWQPRFKNQGDCIQFFNTGK